MCLYSFDCMSVCMYSRMFFLQKLQIIIPTNNPNIQTQKAIPKYTNHIHQYQFPGVKSRAGRFVRTLSDHYVISKNNLLSLFANTFTLRIHNIQPMSSQSPRTQSVRVKQLCCWLKQRFILLAALCYEDCSFSKLH